MRNHARQIAAYLPLLITVALAVLVGSGLAIVVTDDDPSTPDQTIAIPGFPTAVAPANIEPGDGHPTALVRAPGGLVAEADQVLEQDLRDGPTPPAATAAAAKVEATVKPLPEAGAVQGFDGCTTRILPVNFSSRNGARATDQVDHYTVSRNVAGTGDVNAIWNLFANPARQASSNFIIDAEGHCLYAVPIEAKAWTQAAGNPWSISYEIIAFGDERDYLEPAGWAKLRKVQQAVARRTGIPLRRGAIGSNCVPARSGIVQHKDFGLCGGGHVDITPFSIARAVEQVAGPTPVLTELERKLVAAARTPKGTGHSRRYWCRRIGSQLAWLAGAPKVARHDARMRILRRVWTRTCVA